MSGVRLCFCWLTAFSVSLVFSAASSIASSGGEGLFGEATPWVSPGDSRSPRDCRCLFAPSMIGDSLGVPLAVGNATLQVMHTRHFSKVADNNSPIPRTRVFASYQRFDDYNAVETQGNLADIGRDLSVYTLGFEKTVLDGHGSFEFLLPMMRTVSPDSAGPATPLSDEFGNIAFGYKHVLFETDNLLVSGGLRVEAPTQEDITFGGGGQLELDEWYYQPWFGLIASGQNDTFLHCFLSGRYAGGDVEALIVDFGQQTLRQQSLFNVDVGVGRWYHFCGPFLRAVVPTIELHYMHASGADSPMGLTGNIYGGNVDVLNLTLGATAYLGDRSTLQAGFGLPLHSNKSVDPGVNGTIDTDRFYDWEFLVHWTIYSR